MEKVKILLVDDRRENLLALAGVLRGEDREIFQATSGHEALELLIRHQFAVAILDVQMPELNGFELAEMMRSSDDTQGIPIIFVTAGVRDAASTFRGFEAGAVDFMHKPLDDRIVRSKVQVFLDLHRKSRLLEEKVAQLEEAQAELYRTNQDLERFTYIASHDIKEPLRMISSYLGLLSRKIKPSLDQESLEYFEYAITGAKRLGSLIQSLGTHSRASHQALRPVRTDLNQLLSEALQDLKLAISDKGAQVHAAPLPSLFCDPIQVRQVFQNLIANAIKFSSDREPRVEVFAERQEGAWVFSISDNGIGIAEGQLEKIFKPFVRGHSREKYSGDGIGLSVCKIIVERHGGKIWARSTQGEGAIFCFSLPEAKGEENA